MVTDGRPEHIWLDCDGVLADFFGAACRWLGADPQDVPGVWDFFDHIDGVGDLKDFWALLHCQPHPAMFWACVKPYPWAAHSIHCDTDPCLLCRCRQTGIPLTIVTRLAPDPWTEYSRTGKVNWLALHAHGIGVEYVEEGKAQFAAPGHLLIDDCLDNVRAWIEAGGEAWTFRRGWNEGGPNRKRWSEVMEELARWVA